MSNYGFHEVVMSVFDIDRIARPMTATGAFELRALPDAPPGQYAAWHLPATCTRIEQACLAPRGSTDGKGGLRLVRFHGVDQRVMRSSQRSWDTGGIFDIDVFAKDADALYRLLQRHGWTALGEPVDYSEAIFSVRQVVAVGPDGLMVAIIQRYSPPVEEVPAFESVSQIFNSTQMVRDYDRARAFYLDVLGWETRLEFTIDHAAEPGADVLGLPMPQAESAVRRIGMFRPKGTAVGSIELIENCTMRGRDFTEHCVAPNVGLLSMRFPVTDAAAQAAAITARGGTLYAPLARYDIAPFGPVTAFSIRAPDGAILEFFQRL